MNQENDLATETAIIKKRKTYFKNVLFIGPHYNQLGGIASVLEVYSKSIPEFNFISSYDKKNGIYNIFYFANSLLKFVYKLISDRNIKIVHIHSAVRGSFLRKSIFLIIAKIFRKKTILHIHSGWFKQFYNNNPKLQFVIKYILNKPDELVCLSEEWKLYFDSITKSKKSIVVNNPVILPGHIKRIPCSNPIKVLFLNRIVAEKGIIDLAEFFNKNKAWLKGSFKLIVAGAGGAEKEFHEIIKENNLADIIEYKGWVVGKEKEEIIKNCDLFILTSYYEGLPMSILEAMSFGKPIIASKVGGIPQIVKQDENGWLLEAGDIKTLAEIFQQIKFNPGILELYGDKSLEIVKNYSPEKVTEKLNEVYGNLL